MRFFERLSAEGGIPRYFTFALLVFIVSFLLLPTTKMVNNVYYVVLALPAAFVFISRRGYTLKDAPFLLLWGLLLAWYAAVGAWSGDGQYFKHVVYVGLFVLLVSQLVDPAIFRTPLFARGLFWILGAYVFGSAIVFWIAGRYAVGERVLWLPGRMTGPIYTSMWLACCFALAIPTWLHERRRVEMGAALLLAAFCMAYVLQSRSGLVGLLFLLASIGIWMGARKPRQLVWIGAALGALLTLALYGAREVPEFAQLLARADAGRIELWRILIQEWMSCSVWLGCGVSYKTSATILGGAPIQHPHNIYLALLLYSGLVSLLIFLALIVHAMRRAWSRRDPWGLYLLVALVMLNFDGSKLVGNPDELWLLVLLPVALICNVRRDALREGGGRALPMVPGVKGVKGRIAPATGRKPPTTRWRRASVSLSAGIARNAPGCVGQCATTARGGMF